MNSFLYQVAARAVMLIFLLLHGIGYADGHYGFPFILIDGVASKRWEYVRPTNSFRPNLDYSGPTSICGVNGTKLQFSIKTLLVEAGSTVVFGVSFSNSGETSEADETLPWDPEAYIYHPGPASAWMSKAPGELDTYEGDGEWFKIAAVGASDGINWDYGSKEHMNQMKFTIPKTTPPGKYLLRAEHLNIARYINSTQMYINCAHIEVTGSGGGTPNPVTKFPAFNEQDPGIWLPNILYYPEEPMDELKNWQGAGPKVWKG